MDWNDLKTQMGQISLYDIKAGVRKVQNAVMNYTEMESKVREATNNEPWGASSSLMQEIANGTFNYQLLNEIMPMIYKRFTEKSAEEWRQIYKSLQLMEFLVKNGSERVIDDARSHLSLLKMLKQFHFIDANGKDQGINVRNRSKELTDLLSDVERIRTERKKAKGTRNKYGGVEGGAGIGGSGGSGGAGRYGGFGSETGGAPGGGSYGGSTRAVYGDGGGFGGEEGYDEGASAAGPRSGGGDDYEEYDEGDAHASPARRRADPAPAARRTPKKAAPPKPKEPEVDLFDFGDEPAAAIPPSMASNGGSSFSSAILTPPSAASSANVLAADADDDFDDFQSATPSATTTNSIPKPNYSSLASPPLSTQPAKPNYDLFSTVSPPASTASSTSAFASPPLQAQQPKSTSYTPTGPNYFTSVQTQPAQVGLGPSSNSTASNAARPGFGGPAKKPGAGGDAFASLLGGSKLAKGAGAAQKGPTVAELARLKSTQGLYGAPAAPAAPTASNGSAARSGSGLDDLLG